MDALILAGGQSPPELAVATSCIDRACIEVAGQPMMQRVLDALRSTPQIEKIAVVGSAATLQIAGDAVAVEAGGRMVDNLTRGLNALMAPSVLVCTCDIPLVTPSTFEELLRRAQESNLELAYPMVRRVVSEAAFPEGKRTYARLLDGEFTGGNAVIVPRRTIHHVTALVDAAYNARKNPLALARILGPAFLIRFLRKRLTVREIEAKASRVLGCRAGAVEMQDAAIAFDVDKESDLRVAQSVLSKHMV